MNENPMDPFHSVFLHTRITRAHFNPAWGALPIVEWHRFSDRSGIYLTNTRRWNEYIWVRTAETLLPSFAQPPDIYQDPDREKYFPRVGTSKWVVPTDDRSCILIGWRHFRDDLDLGMKGDRTKVGHNRVDAIGQTGFERSKEEAQRVPSDYEAQVGQGEITIHKQEHLGKTDTGVAMLRTMLRRAIRAVTNGKEPVRQKKNADGLIPTMSGDVIVKVLKLNIDDHQQQKQFGRKIGAIVAETMPLSHGERQFEIERRVRSMMT